MPCAGRLGPQGEMVYKVMRRNRPRGAFEILRQEFEAVPPPPKKATPGPLVPPPAP